MFDHHFFVIASDGDLEEGVSHEAALLAGHLGLGRLVYVYDDNHISIDGPTELAFSDDAGPPISRPTAGTWTTWARRPTTPRRSRAPSVEPWRWRTPSLIVLRSHIGWPSPTYTDTEFAHGNPLGEDEVVETKRLLGLPPDETFWVPDDVRELFREAGERGRSEREAWEKRLADFTGDREALDACLAGRGLPGWSDDLPRGNPGSRWPPARPAAPVWPRSLDRVRGSSPEAPTSPATPAPS